MVRVFNVYYPVRTIILFCGEAFLISASFLAAVLIRLGSDSVLVLNYEYGYYKILAITGIVVICLHYFDLYDAERIPSSAEVYVRLLVVLGLLSLLLSAVGYLYPGFLVGQDVFVLGILILTTSLLLWRRTYLWLVGQPYLRERVYVLGTGERARRLVDALRGRRDLGMDVVGWAGALGNGSLTRENLGKKLMALKEERAVDRVIVGLSDGRGLMPVRELLEVRLSGVKVENVTTLLEKISGKIEVLDLNPSWLIFSEGFRLNVTLLFMRRLVSIVVSLFCLTVFLPLIPLIVLLIKLTSPGPVFYRQKRVGREGKIFNCYKFRTMRRNAEADTGPTWALDDDPRITRVGRFLRKVRLDEIPQLWNVLRGDMGFIGPRPERPEFVERLIDEIPYYNLRHCVRPGLTGWAQIRYKYGSSVEDAKQKLQYDLFYIKNMSLGLDFWIIVQTVKVIFLGRGAQ